MNLFIHLDEENWESSRKNDEEKQKIKRNNLPVSGMRGDTSTDFTDVKRIIKYCEKTLWQ